MQILNEQNGKRMFVRHGPALVMVGDASEDAASAYVLGQQREHSLHSTFVGTEIGGSSTARELKALLLSAQYALGEPSLAPLVRHGKLQYRTDSQAALHGAMGMKGGSGTFPLVKETRLLLASADVELQVIWQPRDHKEQAFADFLSKLRDKSQMCLDQKVGNRE